MKYKDILLTASGNMFRSKLRTTLTILAIFIGAFTLTLTNGMGAGISSYVDKQVANLGQKDALLITAKTTQTSANDEPQKYEPGKITSNSGQRTPGANTVVLTEKDIATLKADVNLKDIQPSYAVSPDYIQYNGSAKYKLMSSPISSAAHLDLAAGSLLTSDSPDNQLILPVSYIPVLKFADANDAVNKSITIAITDALGEQHTLTANIVGVQQKGLVSSSGAVFNNTLKNALYNLQSTGLPAASKGKYQSAIAKITGELTDQHISDVKSKLDGMGYSSQTVEDQLGTFKTIVSAITYVLNGFAVIALLAASFGIINTLLMSVQERTKEIGLMKAMGMRSSRIFALFSIEAVLIGLWGSILGSGSAMIVGILVNKIAADTLLKDLPGFDLLSFPPQTIALTVALIMIIAFIAGVLPARRAAKQNPIDALRYE